MKTNNYLDKKTCAECGGKCCKMIPGCCSPSDFQMQNNAKSLKEAIESGKYCLDWYEGDPRKNKDLLDKAFVVRPATKGMEGVLRDPSWGGECTFLANEGCVLEPNNRPLGCRMLEPGKDECITHAGSKRESAIMWLEHTEILESFND